MYYTYVLENPDGLLYKGQTQDLEKRIMEHNNPNNLHTYTANKGPWLLLLSEKYSTRSEAMKREKYLKTGAGRDFLKKLAQKKALH